MAKPQIGDRPLPHDLEAEKAVLGSALVSPELVPKVAELDSQLFSLEKYRRIHARILELVEIGEPVNRLTLVNQLRKQGQLESVDGISGIIDLEGTFDAGNLDSYIRILQEKAALRALIFTGQKMIDQALMGEQTPAEIMAGVGPKLQEIEAAADQKGDGGSNAAQVIDNFPGGLTAFLDPTQQPRGLPTGFTRYDDLTGGLQKGEIVVIAGSTSSGKTALALNIAGNLALNPKLNKTVAIFSLEMSAGSLIRRLLCAHSMVDQYKFRNNYTNPDERRRLQESLSIIYDSHLRIYDQGDLSPAAIENRIRKLKREEDLDVAFVDYLQLAGSHGKIENRNQEISQISRRLVLLSKECQIPIVVLSQLSRAYSKRTDPRPQLSDLRDSGCLSSQTTRLFHSSGVRGMLVSRMNTYSLNKSVEIVERSSKHIDSGIRGLVRVKLRSGRFIDCTPDHKILTDRGFIPAENLTTEHSIAAVRRLPTPSGVVAIPEARWIGWMLGNGSMRGYASPSFICSCEDVAREFCATTKRLFGLEPRPHIHHRCKKVWQYDITAGPVRTSAGNPVKDWLRTHELWGRLSFDKRIPDWFMEQSDNASIAELLAGLWDTDGTVTRGMLKFSTSSNEMAWQVVYLMARLGIFCYLDNGYLSDKATTPVFTISVADGNDILRFRELIPLVGRKRKKLEDVVVSKDCGSNQGDRLGLWVGDEITAAKRNAGLSWKQLGYRVQNKRISQRDLTRVVGKMPELRKAVGHLLSEDIYWDRLEEITWLAFGPTFDREVTNGPHNFVANGIIVHNSIEQDASIVAFIYRDEIFKPDRSDLKGLAELIVKKNRQGALATIPLRFAGNFGRFENRSDDYVPEGDNDD